MFIVIQNIQVFQCLIQQFKLQYQVKIIFMNRKFVNILQSVLIFLVTKTKKNKQQLIAIDAYGICIYKQKYILLTSRHYTEYIQLQQTQICHSPMKKVVRSSARLTKVSPKVSQSNEMIRPVASESELVDMHVQYTQFLEEDEILCDEILLIKNYFQ
ncbi:hypothetical protein SS50377_24842 [Spironucleus salmonicida]|uniref:Uncharacterized protein n=2 Tax=Spironucleus salmonicida TaxID=348837 RepID=A0A9P8LQM6_9EUKA|nr:hypothetical protein SS50377_24842 [Spironucleus salmonicida]